MKITVKNKKEEKKEIPFDEIPVGAVYVARFHDGPIVLKLNDGEAVLLSHSDENEENELSDWFEIADGFKGEPATKILGKLTEIVVEEY